MGRFVGILRSQNALTARNVRQNFAVDFTDAEAIRQAFSESTTHRFEIVDCPLTHLPTALFPERDLLLEAWEALGHAAVPSPEAVCRVLMATVLEQPVSSPPPPQEQPPTARPTAAHPRAYAGTTYKPPKPKAALAQDWRIALCDPRYLGGLEADAGADAADLRLPLGFRTSLYLLVRGQGEAAVAEALSLYWAMALDQDAECLAALVYLFSLQSSSNACAWSRWILDQSPEHWTSLLYLLIASGADTFDVRQRPPAFDAVFAETLDGADPFYRAYWLLHGLTNGINPEYLRAGYQLADTLEMPYKFHEIRFSGYGPTQTLLEWGDYCRDAAGYFSGLLLSLWVECGLRAGLGEHLGQTDYTQLTSSAAYRWLRLLNDSWSDLGTLTEAEASAKWQAAKPCLASMAALTRSVPAAYQEKCVRHLEEYLWLWDTAGELKDNLPSALKLTQRLCQAPFAEKSNPVEIIADFLTSLNAPQRERFLLAPNISFKRLEQACRRENDARLIEGGTDALTRHQAEFSVRCFQSEPERLFHAAKRLGTLSAPMRAACVKAFSVMPDETLRPALARLEQIILDILATGFPAEIRARADPHSLQMQQMIDDNRKALRKFLAAHWEGRADYRQTHPLTKRWLAAHPGLNLETWQRGVTFRKSTDAGSITLSVEQNPLEALKLGTYVGSCLGLGGSFAYSAAAVVLDINKQVVYARDERGAVVGRQLLAISEDDHLVCYWVYPLSAEDEIGRAFAEFDHQFASTLGLPLLQPRGTEYEIAHILSHDWWDDCAWDGKPDE